VLRRYKTAGLARRAARDTRNSAVSLRDRIVRIVEEKGRCVVAVAGSPGSGKSRCAVYIGEKGVFSYPARSITVIDDLRTSEGLKLARGGLANTLRNDASTLVFLFDYRAALYLRRADVCVLVVPLEESRLENLKRRSRRSSLRYGGWRYRYPPFPLLPPYPRFLFVCTGDPLALFKETA
jgi:hypothetical protein